MAECNDTGEGIYWQRGQDKGSSALAVSRIGKAPMTDKEKELFEELWWDLRAMYQRDVAMADNGIPFASRVAEFMKDFNALSLGG